MPIVRRRGHFKNGKPFTPPKYKWAPRWIVELEWVGNKTQVLPLLEYIAKKQSDHSGVWMNGPDAGMCDASWDFEGADDPHARALYRRLEDVVKSCRWWMYVRLRLLHDFEEKKKWKCEWKLQRGKFRLMPVRKLRKRKPRTISRRAA